MQIANLHCAFHNTNRYNRIPDVTIRINYVQPGYKLRRCVAVASSVTIEAAAAA